MRVGHNMWSFGVYSNYKNALTAQSTAMARVSSGLRVNTAADDPYAIAKDQNFNMQIRSIQKANNNSQDTVSLIQTADSALGGISSILDRIRELAVQSKNDTNNGEDRSASQLEVSNLLGEVNHLAQSTNMNNVNLLSSTSASVKCMFGSNVGETIDVPTFNFQTNNIKDGSGNTLASINVTTSAGCDAAMNIVDLALDQINGYRDQYGALENRLTSTISNESDISQETETGDSNIMDADVAAEMMNYSTSSIKVQAGIAMMAQTNKFPQEVLNILQNVK